MALLFKWAQKETQSSLAALSENASGGKRKRNERKNPSRWVFLKKEEEEEEEEKEKRRDKDKRRIPSFIHLFNPLPCYCYFHRQLIPLNEWTENPFFLHEFKMTYTKVKFSREKTGDQQIFFFSRSLILRRLGKCRTIDSRYIIMDVIITAIGEFVWVASYVYFGSGWNTDAHSDAFLLGVLLWIFALVLVLVFLLYSFLYSVRF